jgi:alpha-beta hydrolase superfamily lysophospholipase
MTAHFPHDRRGFLRTAAMSIAAARLGRIGPMTTEVRAPLGAIRQIDAGVLNVGYAESGPADGRAVVLLHGWPYDIHSFVDVAPLLAAAGYRVVVPHLRGYGTTRFRSDDAVRTASRRPSRSTSSR